MSSVYARKIVALVMALALAALTTFQTFAQAVTTTERVVVPIETEITACNGEEVVLSGELLLIIQTTIDDQGGIHEHITRNPRDLQGVGSVTGTQYRGVGGDSSELNVDADVFPLILTAASMFNLVSQGSSDNLQLKTTFHITALGIGEVTAFVDTFSIECVG